MALEIVLSTLCRSLETLREALTSLRTTVVEDKPLEGDVVLVDLFGDSAEDLLGLLDEALAAATRSQQAAAPPIGLHQVRRGLALCQERHNQIAQRFSYDLVSYERIAELLRFGRARGGEWRAWARGVKSALECCQTLLFDTSEALFGAWQELTERTCMMAISAQATSIGYHLAVPAVAHSGE